MGCGGCSEACSTGGPWGVPTQPRGVGAGSIGGPLHASSPSAQLPGGRAGGEVESRPAETDGEYPPHRTPSETTACPSLSSVEGARWLCLWGPRSCRSPALLPCLAARLSNIIVSWILHPLMFFTVSDARKYLVSATSRWSSEEAQRLPSLLLLGGARLCSLNFLLVHKPCLLVTLAAMCPACPVTTSVLGLSGPMPTTT